MSKKQRKYKYPTFEDFWKTVVAMTDGAIFMTPKDVKDWAKTCFEKGRERWNAQKKT